MKIKFSAKLRSLYFKKYDDQMGGLSDEEESLLNKMNHEIDKIFSKVDE